MKARTLEGEGKVRIVRDEHGVPHVQASTEADLYLGLGFAHARDRGMQMLLARVLVQGRACELLADDEDMLALDRFFRRMNLAAGVEVEAQKLSSDAKRSVEAYCDGINRVLSRRLPWELRLLGLRFEPWTAADSILLMRAAGYVALAQSQGEMERLFAEMVQAGVSRDRLQELFPGLLEDCDLDLLRRVRLGQRIVPPTLRWSPALVASNNWVLSAARTASGHALLANDPHLEGNRLPAVWCEAVLELGARYCVCATMPGLPGPALGRTNDLAWGATYTFMDAVDSWVEDCRDGCCRRVEDGREHWRPFRVRDERIRRRRSDDVCMKFYENDHGVLDGDPHEPGLYLATRWASASETGARSIEASLGMFRATDVEAGMALLGEIETAWNWVLADGAGNIGYQMSGWMPRRRAGVTGFAPQPGWDPENDWRGRVPADDLPRAINPPCGFIATANDDLNHLGRVRPINLPMGAYRADRIRQLLAERDDWTVPAVQRMHMDVYSAQAARFMGILAPLLPRGDNADLLRDWDCCYGPESHGAYLFERFYRELVCDVFGAVCGAEVLRFLVAETTILVDFYANFDAVLLDGESRWYADDGREAVFTRVASRALSGPALTWGSQQRFFMRHLLLGGRLPRAFGFDRGPVELRGGRATIHQGQIYRAEGRETSFVPSFRMITELAEDLVYTCLAGGPSDRRFSRWYGSGIADWCAGRFKTLGPRRRDGDDVSR